ncbi:MAG: acyltransferase family protein [Alphaproteobacteria bacterium]
MQQRGYRPDIDGLRAVAIVPVVLYHARLPGVSGGFVGVDVFFVISGFLIAGIVAGEIASGTFSLVRFYERRARRILPALFFVLVVSFAVGGVVLHPEDFVSFGTSAVAALLFASNAYFPGRVDYFGTSSEYKPLLHTWTLGIEEQFYVVLPIVLLFLTRWFGGRRTVLLAGFLVLSFGLGVIGARYAPDFAFYASPMRAWELLIGVLLALGAVPPWPRPWQREAAAAAGLAMIVASIVVYDPGTPFPGVAALAPCLGAGLVLHAGGATLAGNALAVGPVRFVGLVSYSLYLWHWPILAFLRTVQGSVQLSALAAGLGVLGALAVATFSWRYVERPFRAPGVVGRKAVLALAAAGTVGLGALGLVVRVDDGIPERFDARARAILAQAEAERTPWRGCMDVEPGADPCRLGDAEAPVTFVLWGDSHAGALAPAIDVAAKAAGRGGYILAGTACSPLLNVHWGSRRRDWRACDAANDGILAFLETNAGTIDTVVLIARWAVYATGGWAPGEDRPREPVVLRRVDPASDAPAHGEDPFRAGLESLVVRLRAMGMRVVLLGGVPEIGWNVPKTLALGARSLWTLPAPPYLADVRRRNTGADAALTAIARAQGAEVIDVAGILCAPQCAVLDGDRLLYVDDDHLSNYAGRNVVGPALIGRIWPVRNADDGHAEPGESGADTAGPGG